MSEKTEHKFKIPIGDWSDDGHGKCDWYVAVADLPVDDVREAYFRAREMYPELCPENFADEYQNSEIPSGVVTVMRELGYEFVDTDVSRIGVEQVYASSEEMANIVVWFINLGNSDVNARLVPDADVPTLQYGGYDEKMRHIGFIGYGCFY